MTTSLSIDRTSLSLGALVVPSSGFELGTFAPGGMAWQRTFAESRFVNDASLVSARRITTTATGTIRATGSSPSTLQTNEAALIAALSQFTYTVTWTETGSPNAVYTWACWPADVTPDGDQFKSEDRGLFVQAFQVSIPRKSVPTAGSF